MPGGQPHKRIAMLSHYQTNENTETHYILKALWISIVDQKTAIDKK